jgi:hypothetical protein
VPEGVPAHSDDPQLLHSEDHEDRSLRETASDASSIEARFVGMEDAQSSHTTHANSAVCYSLSITAVDPIALDLLFERFLSEERGEWPDIDLDLPSGDEREKVIHYVYAKYGERGAAIGHFAESGWRRTPSGQVHRTSRRECRRNVLS